MKLAALVETGAYSLANLNRSFFLQDAVRRRSRIRTMLPISIIARWSSISVSWDGSDARALSQNSLIS